MLHLSEPFRAMVKTYLTNYTHVAADSADAPLLLAYIPSTDVQIITSHKTYYDYSQLLVQ